MPLWLDGSMARWLDRAGKRKRYFRTLEDIAHILVNEDGPAVNCGRRCRRDALADADTGTS
jgi:hypothetical protein